MNSTTVVMNGTLRPDGTLELGTISALPAGPVRVTVQPMAAIILPSRDPLAFLAEIRRRRQEEGYQGMNDEEMRRYEQEQREEDEAEEARWREIYSHTRYPLDAEGSK